MYFSPGTDDCRGHCGSEETGRASVCSVVSGACSGLMDDCSLNLKGRKMCSFSFSLFVLLPFGHWPNLRKRCLEENLVGE